MESKERMDPQERMDSQERMVQMVILVCQERQETKVAQEKTEIPVILEPLENLEKMVQMVIRAQPVMREMMEHRASRVMTVSVGASHESPLVTRVIPTSLPDIPKRLRPQIALKDLRLSGLDTLSFISKATVTVWP